MRRIILPAIFILIIGATVAFAQKTLKGDIIIKNANIIDVENGLLNGWDVIIKGEQISSIVKHNDRTKYRGTVIDGSGKYLIPGLIDGHTHPFPIKENFPRFIHYGVTSILVTGCGECTEENLAEMRRLSKDDKNPAPRVFKTSEHFTTTIDPSP